MSSPPRLGTLFSCVIRLIGCCLSLVGLYHLVAVFFMTAAGRSQLLFTYLVVGLVLCAVGIRLLRGELAALFRPSGYDRAVGFVALVVLSFCLSWVFGKSFWQLIAIHSPFGIAPLWPLTGLSFLLAFAVASAVWIFHLFVILSPRLRERFQPSLLSHLAALLLLMPSLRLGSQIPAILEFISHPSRQPSKTSNQAMQLTASKPSVYAQGVCHRASGLRASRSGLAAADLVYR